MSRETLKARIRKYAAGQTSNRRLLAGAIRNLNRPHIRECNLCGYRGKFWPFGDPPRPGAVCGNCKSVERHRLVGLWLKENPGVVEGKRLLHFAPEKGLAAIFKTRTDRYRSADLNPHAADTVLNIENIELPDDSVDVVVASHVLEHVDDSKALNEIHRILVKDGIALLMFPVVEGWDRTYENSQHTSDADRTTYFGQFDHVRMYGRDVRDRITTAGFALEEFTAVEPSVARYGLVRGEKIFIAKKTSLPIAR
ncbi:class I SAM-dependent methyltransferase [Mycolicibacterium sp. F2034L]|uniref:methyltransferase domain-containing protein n=1 Tax=Mycolicibacterium sp. F2034L TaxID=2926422 RepID=UPI001FF35101|nr:class I SAM-dependent methyltransferase [Mycolicibacterium sp. F2034L]MCK0173771.1 class I SAM-dependent methyltransferase [Mycolicibacterium sp. F2034L]